MAKKEEKEVIVDVGEVYSKSEEFVNDNANNIMLVVGGLVIIVCLFVGYDRFYAGPLEEEAATDMFQAEQYFGKDSFNLALNGDGNSSGFLDIIDEYGSTDAGNLANYYAGICYLKMKSYDEAIEYLEDYSGSGILEPTALGALGDAYAESGDLDKALSKYESAAKAYENEFTSPIFLFKAGLAAEQLGEYEKAVRHYSRLKEDYANTNEGRNAAKYLARAEAHLN